MKRKLLAIGLTLAMIFSSMGPMVVSAAEASSEVLATGISDGTYTDETADADKAYEYTITGSDGSSQTAVVPAAADETGNSVTGPHTSVAGVYYELVTNLTNGIPEGTYLLVADNKAVTKNQPQNQPYALNVEEVTIENDRINTEATDLEWTISRSNGTYRFLASNEQYLNVDFYDLLADNPTDVAVGINDDTVTLKSLNSGVCIVFNSTNNYVESAWTDDSSITNFSLYKKMTETGGDTYYKVDTTGLNALIEQYSSLSSSNYTTASWNTFETALNAAKELQNLTERFESLESAQAKLNEVNIAQANLIAAYENLEQLDIVTIKPTWQRTLENDSYDWEYSGDLVKGVEYITKANEDDSNYSIITWRDSAEDILNLTTDPSMTVWDYSTGNQYADPSKVHSVDNVSAATWNEHENPDVADNNQWTNGSVRRFTGTFTWPKGYDVDDTVVYQSVNDANYSVIYDYINSNPELKARFGNSRVFPINDDMFVFIRKADETLTTADYLNHMLFWSGTSGKGLWSDSETRANDWERTTPATFNSINALPAFYGIMPNNNDTTSTRATYDGLDIDTMKHTDGWYTLVNSNTVMSTVKSLYGVEDLSNQEMVIDIFCFDNSGTGGMDEIELIFQKTPETATTVQVNYYLDSVMAANLLGSTVMTGVEDGTEITLSAGTNINELDHYRFAAATKAGTVVTNGVQQAPVPYTVDIDKENNIINVVYTSGDASDRVYYFYDFGVENTYIYTPKEEAVLNQEYTITAVSNTNENIKPSISEDGKNVILKYTPTNSLGEMAVGTLNITFDGAYGTEVKPIVIAPASNVLFEENFMTQSTTTDFADWTKEGTVDAAKITDNETTVFGYTDSYKSSAGESGVYTATVTDANAFTDNLQFQFGGTGFDLIGTCGPNTGTIAVKVINSAGASVKNYLVDTSFTDTTDVVSEGTTIYQVPLLQAKDLPEDTYTVTIRGAYIVYDSAAETYALDETNNAGGTDAIADLYDLMYGVGMTEDDIDSVEYINMGKMMGASTYSVTDDTTEGTATTTVPESMIIGIDGFRSYRATDYDKYPEAELGVTYQNILDCVSDGFAAYIETREDGTYQVNNYEISGGPQNEIYLTNENGALAIGQSNSLSKQISLRSVDGKDVTVKVNGGERQTNGKTITLKHTTEMYYEVTANDDGHIVIQVESGFLGIGNLKLTSGNAEEAAVMPTAMTEDDYALVATTMRLYATPPVEELPVFVPEKFDAYAEVRNNKIIYTITTSDDVEYITVNDDAVYKFKKKRGSKVKEFTYTIKLKKGQRIPTVDIIAYNEEDIESNILTYTAKSNGKNENKKGGRR